MTGKARGKEEEDIVPILNFIKKIGLNCVFLGRSWIVVLLKAICCVSTIVCLIQP